MTPDQRIHFAEIKFLLNKTAENWREWARLVAAHTREVIKRELREIEDRERSLWILEKGLM